MSESFRDPNSFPQRYIVVVKSLTFTGLPMDEAGARKYIESTPPGQRLVAFDPGFQISNNAPRLTKNNQNSPTPYQLVEFTGDIEKITVVKANGVARPVSRGLSVAAMSGETIGLLYNK